VQFSLVCISSPLQFGRWNVIFHRWVPMAKTPFSNHSQLCQDLVVFCIIYGNFPVLNTGWYTAGITYRMPVGTLVPLEGFWGAYENFRIFIRCFKCLMF
jgi:hypothetical protein